MARSKFVALIARLEALGVADPDAAIKEHRVLVDGRFARNPRTLVPRGAAIRVLAPKELRGTRKLREAMERFGIAVEGRVALDLGAAAGGFTVALLRAGAAGVYAVDAGVGQLRGSLRRDPRVRNLERTNLGELTVDRVPEEIHVVTMDLSYLSIATAVGQLDALRFGSPADLVALVKPMFELGLPAPPTDGLRLRNALHSASAGCEAAGWKVVGTFTSSIGGAAGAIEFFLRARRDG